MEIADLDKFKLARFEFVLTAIDELSLTLYAGSTLRGGFGYAFKRVTCCNPQEECSQCLIKDRCVYFYVFENSLSQVKKNLKRYQGGTPHPFIIEPPNASLQKYFPGEELKFNLTLIGQAIDYLPYFIYTFDELGRLGVGKGRGKLNLSQVISLPLKDEPIPIYDGNSKQLLNSYQVITITNILEQVAKYKDTQQITLNFLTPTRIKYQDRLTSNLDFDVLIGNLIRRLASLLYFHCGQSLTIDYDKVIEEAKAIQTASSHLGWYDWERYSTRQETRMKLGGFLGKITYQGKGLAEFLPLLLIGRLIHIGNGATFGLGRYEVRANASKICLGR